MRGSAVEQPYPYYDAFVQKVRPGAGSGIPKEPEQGTKRLTVTSFRLNDPTRPSVSSHHTLNGPHVLTVDGMVMSLRRGLPPETLRALLTIAEGERIDRSEWDP